MSDEGREAERMADLLRRRADVYSPDRQKPSYYGDDDIDLLRARLAAVEQERDALCESLLVHQDSLNRCISERDAALAEAKALGETVKTLIDNAHATGDAVLAALDAKDKP
jgi:hypothetical protein